MAVTIDATNLTLVDAADATTGWTSSMGGLNTTALLTREGGTSLQDQASEEQYNVYHTIGSTSIAAHTVFGWMRSGGPATEADASGAGFAMYMGDGTNNRAYDVGGSDNYAFFFSGWSSFRLNTEGLPTSFIQDGGGAPTFTTITRVGYAGQFPAKAAGNSDNVAFDVLRYVSNTAPALLVEGGTTGDRGTWAELTTEDESTSNAWGIIRSLVSGGKAYEVMFGLQVGSLDADSYFDDEDFQVFLNGALTSGATITAGSMDVDFVGDSGSTNVINFNNFLFQGIGTVSNWTLSNDVDEAHWSNGQLVDLGTISFPSNQDVDKDLEAMIFTNCGQISFGATDANGCTINGSTNADGAVGWTATTVEENQDNITFNSDGTGHAIHIVIDSATETIFNIDGYVFDGYAGQLGTAGDRVFLVDNPSDGLVTINVTNSSALNVQGGGAGFSYELAAGTTSTVDIIQTVTLNVQVDDETGTGLEDVFVSIRDASDNTLVSEGRTNSSGLYTDGSYNYGGDLGVEVEIRRNSPGYTRYLPERPAGTIESTGLSLTQKMTVDPNVGVVSVGDFRIAKQGLVSNNVSGTTLTANLKLPISSTGNRKLIVSTGYNGGASQTVSAITYDGNAMTSIVDETTQTDNRAHLYRYDIPDTDEGDKIISVTFSGSVSERFIQFAVVNKAATGAPDQSATDDGAAQTTDPTVTLVPTAAALELMMIMTDDLTIPVAAGTGDDVRRMRSDNLVSDTWQGILMSNNEGASGSHTIISDLSASSKDWVAVACSLLEA